MTELERTALGRISVSQAALGRIVVRTAEEVEGARVRRARRGLTIEVADGRAGVCLELSVRQGAVIPEVVHEVQERVAAALRAMVGVEAGAVNVTVEELH